MAQAYGITRNSGGNIPQCMKRIHKSVKRMVEDKFCNRVVKLRSAEHWNGIRILRSKII
jgi:hypothetical protein